MEIDGITLAFDLPDAIEPEQWNSLCFLMDGSIGSFDIVYNSKRLKNGSYAFLKGSMNLDETVRFGTYKTFLINGSHLINGCFEICYLRTLWNIHNVWLFCISIFNKSSAKLMCSKLKL